jgi:hypothetical protein
VIRKKLVAIISIISFAFLGTGALIELSRGARAQAAPQFVKVGTTGKQGRITFTNVGYPNGVKNFASPFNPIITGNNIYAPDLLRVGDQWYCYYGGWQDVGQPFDRIYLAESDDLEPVGPWPTMTTVITEGLHYWHVNDPSVVFDNGIWHMVYTDGWLDTFSGFQYFLWNDVLTLLGPTDTGFDFLADDFNQDDIVDLVVIKKSGTGTHSTEVHILNGAPYSNTRSFQSWLLQTGTPLPETDHTYDFVIGDYNVDSIPDLVVIKKSGTGGSTIVHILDGASGFTGWLLHALTPLPETDDTYDFVMGDYNVDSRPDLVVIKKSGTGTGSTEVHILDGASGFTGWLLQTGTPLPETDDTYDFVMGNYNVGIDRPNDRVPDLVAIKKSGTGTGSTEVHILDGASGFQNWLLQTRTPLPETDDTWDFAMGDWYVLPGISDLITIKKSTTVTTEIHILEGPEWKEWINYSSSMDGKVWLPSMGEFSSEIIMTDPLSLAGGSIVHIARPSLVKTPNGWRMWFDAKVIANSKKEIVPQSYLAEAESLSPPSPRFRVVHKYDPLPSGVLSFAAPDVARRPDGTYVAVVERDNSETLYLATSPNGITFTLTSEPVLRADELTLGQKKVHNPGLLYDQVSDQLLGLAFGMTVRSDYLGSDIGFSYTQYEIQIQSPDGTWHVYAEGDTLTDQSVLVFNYTEFEKVRLIDPVTGQILLEQDFTDAQVGDLYRLFWPISVPCNTRALIDAIDAANNNGEADLLSLASGCTYVLESVNNDAHGFNGLPSITSGIIINGNGATIERSSAVGTPDFRIFHVAAGGDLTLNQLTVRNGTASGTFPGNIGGGIGNWGAAKLVDVTVRDNRSNAAGGGIGNNGTLELVNSTVTRNSATDLGGGIANANVGTVQSTDSTVSYNSATSTGEGGGIYNDGVVELTSSTVGSGNLARNGGGIYNNDGTMRLTNSTVSGNLAFDGGGGIYHSRGDVATVLYSTISSNIADVGGGIFVAPYQTMELGGTIVSKQISGGSCLGGMGKISSRGYNLISDITDCGFVPASGDMWGTGEDLLDPILSKLKDNGGPTWTHALMRASDPSSSIDSPAIDVIPSASCLSEDQRGLSRSVDIVDIGDDGGSKPCDMGAFERQEGETAITLLSFTAQAGTDHVTLAWQTGSEVDNAGFNLWRAMAEDGPYTKLNKALIPAEGDPESGASYTYTDADVVKGVTYYYKLEDVDVHGVSTFHGPVSATPGRIRWIYLPLVFD